MNIVHIAKTPLAGSPSRLSDELNKVDNVHSVCFIERDYPGELSGKFIGSSIVIDKTTLSLLINKVEDADICHIHNDLSRDTLNLILANAESCKFIYHVHSPLREGPLFFNNYTSMEVDFDAKIVVAQYHPRQYQDFIPVLNIVPFKPSTAPSPLGGKIRILFSPSHSRTGGRWNDKTSPELERALNLISKRDDVEVIIPGKLSPSALFELRRTCHITIDEIVTGSYHQISLEGLAAGNVVINNSDALSNMFLEMIANANTTPPFLTLNNKTILAGLTELLNNRDSISQLQKMSLAYYKKHLQPSKTASRLISIYKGEI
ncbi:hypothetical protein [Aeromonas veronii]|uniref:hypothetical protein n=1 Tax=Aeromonas veronii TaxID=654 RepID=UPI001F24890C|nr:hypothetical protein [Aeromonas veronii]MCF5866928.1 hypothetical protein [Aeromonas veronii]